jgi:hypothetical protein
MGVAMAEERLSIPYAVGRGFLKAIVALILIGALLIGWLVFEHQTRFAPGFNEYAFTKLHTGMTFAEVYDQLGAPLAIWEWRDSGDVIEHDPTSAAIFADRTPQGERYQWAYTTQVQRGRTWLERSVFFGRNGTVDFTVARVS